MSRKGRQIEDLAKRNKWFNSLSPSEKRVEIARDVVFSLKNDLFKPESSYLQIYLTRSPYINTDLQFHIEDGSCECRGCGIAAMLYSRIVLGDKSLINGYELLVTGPYTSYDYQVHKGYVSIKNELKGIFSPKGLLMIEAAFERVRDTLMSSKYTDISTKRAVKFGKKYKDNSDRLIAICKNIIINKGTFKP